MSVGENQEQSRTDSSAEETGGQGSQEAPPATPYAKEGTHRTGSKLDIRLTGDEEGDSAPTPPPDRLRDGT